MQLYARIFLQILDSSIAEDFTTRHVFEDLLKLSDDGIVDMTRHALARRINCPMEILNECLAKLESPDPQSRDKDFEGRRIEKLDEHRDWGWKILNWEKYEAIRTRAQNYERVIRHRKNKAKPENGGPKSAFVKPTLEEVKLHCAKIGLPESEALRFVGYYESNGWKVSKNPMKSWHGAMATWKANWEERHRPGKLNTVAHESPPWQQLKAVESLLQDCDKKLKQITVPNHELFPEDYKRACALRTPIVEEKHRLAEQKRELTKLVASNGQNS